ncbi:hypothetical protein [Mucilaginibacter sp. R-33]|uniref:hypothetical protein n=1 Tax=Mucilaginibacter sp. R-33 TaxID=3416711 RepID=UPI003CF63D34
MKYALILFFNVFSLTAFSQSNKLSLFKEKKIKIVNTYLDDEPNKLPLLTITILNSTKQNIIFNRILVNIIQFKKHPTSSSNNGDLISRALSPIAALDLNLQQKEDSYLYSLKTPIEIVLKDAATIQVRLRSDLGKKHLIPSQIGYFKFTLTFITYDNKGIITNPFLLGDSI